MYKIIPACLRGFLPGPARLEPVLKCCPFLSLFQPFVSRAPLPLWQNCCHSNLTCSDVFAILRGARGNAFKTKIITFKGTTRKFITKRYRRARKPSRISLRFLRRLENQSGMLKKFLFKRIRRFLYRSSQSCIAKLMLKRLESFIVHVINVIINTIQRYFI